MNTGADFCPYFQEAVELIGRRWTGVVLRTLLPGPLRFSEMERAIPEISARALAQRLRELEAAGLLVRGVDTGVPIRVSYALTEKGRALGGVVERIERWAHGWLAPRGVNPHRRPVSHRISRRTPPRPMGARRAARTVPAAQGRRHNA